MPFQNASSNYSSCLCRFFNWTWILKSAFQWRLEPLSEASLSLKAPAAQADKAILWHAIIKKKKQITKYMCTGSRGFCPYSL